MPRVSDAYREARRDEIARAALRSLERNGLEDMTIADIVRESGLSAGAIYANFANKAELARYVVSRFLTGRRDLIEDDARRGEVRTPRELLETVLSAFEPGGITPAVPLQFWAAAAVDEQMHDELTRTVDDLRTSLTHAVTPWATPRGIDPESAARAIMKLGQGYITHAAIEGQVPLENYLAGLTWVVND